MDKTYWENHGKYQALYNKLHQLIPSQGSVFRPEQNPALEKLRKASNCYYDLYNNGLCNMATEFYQVFKMSGRKILRNSPPYSAEL